ncbi:hypothetical protein BKA66DRAFT_570844 [Pyrenochaeta sp. MPI-SDFR-AT-0127]|nr:hypothetical protein BKA66DRAFT_570844 [Pyrenochaeta sp. MPI-SDFR-AT-0127]
MLRAVILTLFALVFVAKAVPAGTALYVPAPVETVDYSPPKSPEETVCTASYWTITNVEDGATTYLSTQTVILPITTVIEKPVTAVSAYPYTSTVVSLTTHLATKTYSTVTTILDTKVESDVESNTHSVGTSYGTTVDTVKETIVTTQTTNSVHTDIVKVPVTSISTGSKDICTTKHGYGHD